MSSVSSPLLVHQLLQCCTGQQAKIPFLPALFPKWRADFYLKDGLSVQDDLNQSQRTWIQRRLYPVP